MDLIYFSLIFVHWFWNDIKRILILSLILIKKGIKALKTLCVQSKLLYNTKCLYRVITAPYPPLIRKTVVGVVRASCQHLRYTNNDQQWQKCRVFWGARYAVKTSQQSNNFSLMWRNVVYIYKFQPKSIRAEYCQKAPNPIQPGPGGLGELQATS